MSEAIPRSRVLTNKREKKDSAALSDMGNVGISPGTIMIGWGVHTGQKAEWENEPNTRTKAAIDLPSFTYYMQTNKRQQFGALIGPTKRTSMVLCGSQWLYNSAQVTK